MNAFHAEVHQREIGLLQPRPRGAFPSLKVRPLITAMNNNYMQLYNVSRKVSIDESMILYKGRHSIKQYNPMKPIKRGYKLWVRADMDGYISKFDVYQGKTDTSSVGDFMLRDNIVTRMFKLGLDFMRQ